MEFNLTDDRVLIENLQKMLRLIWLVTGDDGYEVGVSGVYGEETEQSVRYFQQTHNIPVTGVVDFPTWTAIAEEYDRLSLYGEPPLGIRPFLPEGKAIVKSGERSDLVTIIQIMLNTLDVLYDFGYVPISGLYEQGTVDAVRKFQEINALPSPSGAVDRLTWNAMADAYNKALRYD